MPHKRFGFLSRTLLIAALCVAAVGVIGGLRAARAETAPAPSADAQKAAWLLAGQNAGNPAMGLTAMQILWGGTKGKETKVELTGESMHQKGGNKGEQRHRRLPVKNEQEYRQGK